MGLIVMSSGLYCCMLSASLYSSSSVFCTLWFISGGGGLMGGEVTVYSGAPMLGAADAGMLGISWKLRPGMSNPGICIPLIGGMPPIILDISLDIIEEDELEKEDEDVLLEEEFMLIDPIFDIIFPIMSSMPSDGMPPIIMPPGIGPPEDIIVEDEDEEEEDLKLDMVDPSSDLVVAAMLWLLALSSFLTATP